MERNEILYLCRSNPEAIVDRINSLEIELSGVKEELNEAKEELITLKEEIRNLKALLNQNSQNSSKPPSTDTFAKKKTQNADKKSGRLPGGQKGHRGSTLKPFDSPHKIVNLRLCNCKYCGHDL
jgi:transposase